MPTIRRLQPALLIALCVLAMIGCRPAGYGSTRPLVKIGLAAPFEGLGRPLGYEALQGVKAALAERNGAGGVGGYMVELVALNDSNRPTEAMAQAGEFAADPAVVGVITGWNTAVATAALPAYRQAGLPVVVPWTVPAELASRREGVVLLAADSDQVARAMAGRLAGSGLADEVAVTGQTEAITLHLEQLALPARVVALPSAPDDATMNEWAARLLLARTAPPAALVLMTDGVQAGGIVRAVRETGWDGVIYGGPEAVSPQLADVAGRSADGIVLASPAPAGYDLAATSGGDTAMIGNLSPRAVMAYDATLVLLSAIEAAIRIDGRPTREGVVRTLPDARLRGLTGDLAFGTEGQRVNVDVWWYEYEAARYPGRRVE